MNERDILKELGRVESLPTLPEMVTRVTAEIDGEDADVGCVSELIAQDPAMTGQILRMANSVMFSASGLSTPSIREAVGRIGLTGVRNLVVSLGVVDAFEAKDGLDYREFWRHSFSSAVAAGTVAGHLPQLSSKVSRRDNPYFLAGLLHDVGTLLFSHALGAEFVELIQDARERGVLLHELERERLGADHQEVGAALIRRWGLPFEVAAAAEHHHGIDAAPDDGRDYVMVVSLADAVLGRNGRCSPAEPAELSGVESDALGFDEAELAELTAEVMAAAESSDALLAAAISA